MPERLVITGSVQPVDDLSASEITIRALDRDLPSLERLRGPQVLGEAACDAEGRFTIEVDAAASAEGEARPRLAPDVGFEAFDRQREALVVRRVEAHAEVGPDLTIFDVRERLDVVLHLARREREQASEYERLTDALAPVIRELSAADLRDDDLRFLRRELPNEDPEHVILLRAAAFLSRLSGVTQASFYGWARMNVPDVWHDMPSFDDARARDDFVSRVLDTLAATDAARLTEALRRAAGERIIHREFSDRAEALGHQLRRRRLVPKTVRFRLVADTQEDMALASYVVDARDAEAGRDLGEDITDAGGEIEVTYDADPENPNAPRALVLTVSGPALTAPVSREVELRPRADDQPAAVVRIPWPATSGNLGGLVDDGRLSLPSAVIERMRAAGITTLADVRRAGGVARIDALAGADPATVRRLAAFADLDRVTAEPAVVAALMESGYESVIAIANTPWNAFVSGMAPPGARDDAAYERAVRLRAAAQAQVGYLDLLATAVAADLANGAQP